MEPYSPLNDPIRPIIFQYHRYSVTKNTKNGLWTLWYRESICAMDNNREKIIDRFKQAMENMEAMSA